MNAQELIRSTMAAYNNMVLPGDETAIARAMIMILENTGLKYNESHLTSPQLVKLGEEFPAVKPRVDRIHVAAKLAMVQVHRQAVVNARDSLEAFCLSRR